MTSDAILKIRFSTPAEGGRASSVRGPLYGCPLIVAGSHHDCRLLLGDLVLELGLTYEVPVKFLDPEAVLSKLEVGGRIQLWEGRIVGVGTVVKIGGT